MASARANAMFQSLGHICRLSLIILGCALAASSMATDAGPPVKTRDWPLVRGDAQARGVAHGDLSGQLDLLWKFSTKEGGFEGSAVIVDGVVYAGSLDGNLYAIDLASGQKKWAYKTELGFSASPAVAGGLVYVGDADGKFYCIDAAKGEFKWSFEAQAEIDSSANFHKDRVLFGSQDSNLYCLDAKSGELVWKYAIGDQIRCSPTVVGDRAFVAGCDSKLHVVDLTTGKAMGTVPIGAPTGSTPAVEGDFAYFGTEGATFFCIDYQQAKVVWTYEAKRKMPLRSSVAVTDNLVIFGGRDKLVMALAKSDGTRQWSYPTRARVDSSPVVVGDRVFVGSADGRLYGFDLKGDLRWEYEAGGQFTASPAVAGDRLVIGNTDGTLFCFGHKSAAKGPGTN